MKCVIEFVSIYQWKESEPLYHEIIECHWSLVWYHVTISVLSVTHCVLHAGIDVL